MTFRSRQAPHDFAIDPILGCSQTRPRRNSSGRDVISMNVGDDGPDAVLCEPLDQCNGRLGCVSLPLPADADRPRDDRHCCQIGMHHRGLNGANRCIVIAAADDPVEPSFAASSRTLNPQPVTIAKLVERCRCTAGEVVQRRIGQHFDQFLGIVNAQRSEQQALGHNRRDVAQSADFRTITVTARLMCCTQEP